MAFECQRSGLWGWQKETVCLIQQSDQLIVDFGLWQYSAVWWIWCMLALWCVGLGQAVDNRLLLCMIILRVWELVVINYLWTISLYICCVAIWPINSYYVIKANTRCECGLELIPSMWMQYSPEKLALAGLNRDEILTRFSLVYIELWLSNCYKISASAHFDNFLLV